MAHRLMMEDIERLCREINIEYGEALALLLHTQGDYKKAVRLHQDKHSIFIQPEQVTDGKTPFMAFWKEKLSSIQRTLGLAFSRLGKWARRIPALLLLLALALLIVPHLTILLGVMLIGHFFIAHTRRFLAQMTF